ncbi:MAG: CsbD family protein, partial [Rhodococcus sp. (in: high G+C Gram-positive bacteria)]
MSNENASEEARKGLFDAVKGKAKEVVGAVTGNDSLTTEGQLQSAQARERAEANATEMAAQAQSEEAAEDLAAVRNTAEQQRDAASASAESSAESARRVQQAQ